VKHDPGTFIVNSFTRKINGIEKGDLANGIPLNKVKAMVHEIIKDKLVVVCNGVKDFLSLQLEFSEYETFEIQKIFRGWNQTYNKLGAKVYQPKGLKKLIKEYFNVDIQEGVHDASIDAHYTLELFKVICIPYMKERNIDSSDYEFNGDDFDGIAMKN